MIAGSGEAPGRSWPELVASPLNVDDGVGIGRGGGDSCNLNEVVLSGVEGGGRGATLVRKANGAPGIRPLELLNLVLRTWNGTPCGGWLNLKSELQCVRVVVDGEDGLIRR